MSNYAYNLKSALANKMIRADGTITDMLGNAVGDTVHEYDIKGALPNKFLNPDGTYSTLNEILAKATKAEIFVPVTELPEIGEENKIYLVANGDGFDEWYYEDGRWDNMGILKIDMANYPTTEQMNNAINDAIYKTLGGEY